MNRDQRRTLADKLPDMANVAVGALVFGQFLGNRPFSPAVAISGAALWIVVIATVVMLGRTMTGIYIIFGTIALFTLGVLIYDLITRPPGHRNAHK